MYLVSKKLQLNSNKPNIRYPSVQMTPPSHWALPGTETMNPRDTTTRLEWSRLKEIVIIPLLYTSIVIMELLHEFFTIKTHLV